MKRFLPALVVLVSFLAAPATAQDYDKGEAAYNRGDYAAALREWRPLAERGVVEAQLNVGNMYHQGEGVPKDHIESFKLHRLAAEEGDVRGQFSLGGKYYFGQGIPQDFAKAAKWYRKSAEQGDLLAQYAIGKMYEDGKGVPQDFAQAHMFFNLSAAAGSAFSAFKRDFIAEKMTPADISKAQRMAREWLEAHPQ